MRVRVLRVVCVLYVACGVCVINYVRPVLCVCDRWVDELDL